ncbi:MAG TPA: UvrD-helicase domain-containing protein [Acidimicrobiales bacterium]|nr:UvrD-helicase domain-containing protein [Acidimicrobiales bacterium]
MNGLEKFDPCGELPTGITVLEASAGTGKTFTIAGLATRYVAEGAVPLERLMLVTFTRMATGELRERVRSRLVHTEQALAGALAGAAPAGADDVTRFLARGTPEELELRRRRLADAVADFDAATIDTTHGFCQQVLAGLGTAGDVERDVTFAEDLSELVEQVVDDLYVRRFFVAGDAPFTRAEALVIAKAAVAHPSAAVQPAAADPSTAWAMRVRLANAVRKEVEKRKRAARVITYDDLLTRLAGTLADPSARGEAACRRLRDRYQVTLVDEFQDTDPTQWDILRRAFGQGGSTLVLIGDPKQAIYAFRGADVYAYLDAARAAGRRATLSVNWRSDQGLVDAYDALFGGARLGHPDIAYARVEASGDHQHARLLGAPSPAPLRARILHRADGLAALRSKDGFVELNDARRAVAADVAADLVRLLSSGTTLEGAHPLRPGHVAVLVRTHHHAAMVRDALEAVRIPAVINGAGSVLDTPVARRWLMLLEALERPASPSRARAAALTPFLGWSVEKLAGAGEDDLEQLHGRLQAWAAILRRRGVAALLETVTHTSDLPARLLAQDDGERLLTDLRHVGQLLHAEAVSEGLGATALTAWLRQRIAEAGEDTSSEERSRRLESDAEAVQILTIHRSKGLEFPVVYCPYLWEPGWIPDARRAPALYHDPAAGDRATLHVGMGGGHGFFDARRQWIHEQRGEDLRLAYVALTRARHQAVVWWAAGWNTKASPLCRLLFSRDADGNVDDEAPVVPSDSEVVARFEALAAAAPGRVSVERVTGPDGNVLAPQRVSAASLAVRSFDRPLDAAWRRTSYTGITSGAHDARVASEPEEGGVADEPDGEAAAPMPALDPGDEALRAVPSPLAGMPAGPEVGTLVHAVLEAADFAAADLDTALGAAVAEEVRWRGVDVGDPVAVAAGLRAALETPLGPLAGGAALRQVERAHRLDELGFELPLVGGDAPAPATLHLDAIAGLLRHRLPAGDPLAAYPARLADPALGGELRGYLVGSIDLVLRLPGPRFVVVDHKTNRLAPAGTPLTAWHYRPAALAAAMYDAHYPLQALLYSVALHRYLRWRLPGYDPDRHLGGVLYLFLRGMTGPAVPVVDGHPCGVFSWSPPAGLVPALSDLLDAGIPDHVAAGAAR